MQSPRPLAEVVARVAFVLPSFAGGGAERVIITLANRLPSSRFLSTLVMLRAVGPLRDIVAPHVDVVDIDRPRVRHARHAMVHVLEAISPSVIVSTMAHLNIGVLSICHRLTDRARIVVREANDPVATLRRSGLPWLHRLLYRRYYPRADLILCPSHGIRHSLTCITGLPYNRFAVMHNPVDVTGLRQKATPARREAGTGARFVAAGRLTEQKGFDRLIGMLAHLPDAAHLTVLGDGPMEASLREQANRLGLAQRVRFEGYIENPWTYFSGADAFLLPSRWEGMPNAALEALACGTPVIATPEAGGIVEIGDETTPGAVTIAQDGTDFVAAMRKVHADPVSTPRPSLLPESFALDTVLEDFVHHLDSLSAERP